MSYKRTCTYSVNDTKQFWTLQEKKRHTMELSLAN